MTDLITQAKPVFEAGTILAQISQFSGFKTVDKVSLSLSVVNEKIQTMIVGSGNSLTFQAANFKTGRETWAFQPVVHWTAENNWETSGTTIQNTRQVGSFTNSTSSAFGAPFLQYDVFFDEDGVYDLWGLGSTSSEGVFWSFDKDTTDMRRMVLGQPSGRPEWTKFGTFFSKGGSHTFYIYLSDASIVRLDQWHFTSDTNFDSIISSTGQEFIPVTTLSKAPFNTAVRLRTLSGTDLDSLSNPISGAEIQTVWLSSENITASSRYNYLFDNDETGIVFDGGLSLELWQIGGSSEHFLSWNFNFPESSIGNALISTDYGENFTKIS